MKFFGDWSDTDWRGLSGIDAMRKDFEVGNDELFPTEEEVLYADYNYIDYEGSAFVLFERDGKLYEVHGGHCSCYGLEGQWIPEETSWPAIAMRPNLPPEVRDMVAARL